MKEITHAILVRAAAQWLSNRCRVVATEIVTRASETPDVIGWESDGRSIVIECKITYADFLADENKPHIRARSSIGDLRYYLAPSGILKECYIPNGYGFLEYKLSAHTKGYFIGKIKEPVQRARTDASVNDERKLLISLAGRSLEALNRVKALYLGAEIPG